MDPQYLLAIQHGRDLLERQLSSPEWHHRAAWLAERESWRRRAGRRMRQWRDYVGRRPLSPIRLAHAARQDSC
jgi:hypothetical protein